MPTDTPMTSDTIWYRRGFIEGELANIHVRDVPDTVLAALDRRARERG